MIPNLHHLQLFYYVAKAKGISGAVKIIPYGIQQPAVSQQMAQLEKEIGAELFRRRPFELTPAGERLFTFVSRFFDNIENEMAMVKDSSGIRIRFGCPAFISSNYFPEFISTVLKKYPQIRPQITELNGYESYNELVNRQIDVSLSFGNLPHSKAVTVKNILTLPMSLIVPASHRFVKNGFWAKSDFKDEKWIAVQQKSGGTQELLEGLTKLGISPEFSASTNSIEAALKYVELNIGIALIVTPPAEILKQFKIKALPAEELFGKVSLSIAWLNDSSINAKMLDFIYSAAKELSSRQSLK